MNQEIVLKLTRARATLILDQPFFGALALRLPLIEDTSVKTMATNGHCIKYNPTFVGTLSAGLTKAIIAHEVMHCVLDHVGRSSARDSRWGQATDYVANQLLEDVGFDFEGTGLLNPAFKGMSADHVYSLLPPPDENGDNGHGDPLDDMEPGDPDPAAQAEAAREWKVATIQAANAAKIMGKLPGNLERFIDQLFKAQVDWKAVLRQFIHEISRTDYAWTKPNKHMLVHGVYMPSLHSESMGDIVIGIDVSGSIDEPTLDAFGAEINAIVAETMPANVHLVYCDSRVAGTQSFARHEEVNMKPVGGGGTEFKPVFDWVEENNIRPVCLVYLTDLYGDTSFAPPEYPTLWCCTNEQVAPFGDTVHIEV